MKNLKGKKTGTPDKFIGTGKKEFYRIAPEFCRILKTSADSSVVDLREEYEVPAGLNEFRYRQRFLTK